MSAPKLPEFATEAARTFASMSAVSLAAVLDQSVDCVKFVDPDGVVAYINSGGVCGLEIDDVGTVLGQPWITFWPASARAMIRSAYDTARGGVPARFRAFKPTMRGNPRWWDITVSSVADSDGVHAGFLAISRDVTESELAREALEVAGAELKHRLKNTYAMIGSLLSLHAQGDAVAVRFASEMGQRLVALGTAQALFASNDAPCAVAELIPLLLDPFASTKCRTTIGTMPDTMLEQGQADAIALVIGELSINATKHGALAHGGSIDVTASADVHALRIGWSETIDGVVARRERVGGQGLRLMDRIVRARRGTFALAWRDDGLDVTVTFDVAAIPVPTLDVRRAA